MEIVKTKKIWFLLSAAMTIASIGFVVVWGLKPGIDFAGGAFLEAKFKTNTQIEQVREPVEARIGELGVASVSVAETDSNTFLIKLPNISKDQINDLRTTLSQVGEWEELKFENVGPTIGKNLTQKAILAVVLATLAIVLYIALSFRHVSGVLNSWKFGSTAIFTVAHDLIIVVGIYAILGHYFRFELDSLFVTALLTLMGYSVNDKIVVFDRIRENLKGHTFGNIEPKIGNAVSQTLARSINTSLTVMFVLIALLVLGGDSIRAFVSTLLVGVIVCAYSSIFIAANVLAAWQTKKRS